MKAATDFKFTGDVKFEFQSTPPVKAATAAEGKKAGVIGVISIHAAREGGDLDVAKHFENGALFQSTPPVKAATRLSESL